MGLQRHALALLDPETILPGVPSGSDLASCTEFDAFVSYASEDREAFVKSLTDALVARGVNVWVDYGEITLGDSLRKKIDDGLLRSRFAVVVVSPHSLEKFWTNNEVDALFALEAATGSKRILPVLHQLTHKELTFRSPLLASRLAENSHDLNKVVEAIFRVVQGTLASPAGAHSTKTYNVPQRLPTFVGRTLDLERVEEALRGKDVAVSAAISGLAGIGKSALATELAHRLAAQGRFPGGIYWLPAADPDLGLVWASNPLGGAIAPDADCKDRAAEAVLRLSRMQLDVLLILDNVVSWLADERPRLLPQGGHVHLLVTTRERNLGGTQLAQVELGVLPPDDARNLLLATAARAIEPGVDALLTYLDGHALAIELAGAYLREFVEGSASDYLAALQRGAPVEDRVPPDRTRYERTTQQALRALWQRLDADTQSAWCLVATFADAPVSIDLSESCGLDEAGRARLRRFHLIDLDLVARRWHAHRLVTAFGRTEPGVVQRTAAHEAFVRGCAEFADSVDPFGAQRLDPASIAHLDHSVSADIAAVVLAPVEYSQFLNRVGIALISAGNYAHAKARLERGLEILGKDPVDDHRGLAAHRSALGMALYSLGDLRGAKHQNELALATAREHLGDDHRDVATIRANLGLVLRDLGDLADARQMFELVLPCIRKHYGDDHASVAGVRSNLGLVLHDLGDLEGAKREFEWVIESCCSIFGDHDRSVALVRSNLGNVLHDMRDLEGARRQLQLALDSDLRNLGEGHPNVAIRRSNLGAVLLDGGDLQSARLARLEVEKSLESDRKNFGEDHPNVGIRHSILGQILFRLGDRDGARRERDEALRIARLQPPGSLSRIQTERTWLQPHLR